MNIVKCDVVSNEPDPADYGNGSIECTEENELDVNNISEIKITGKNND